MLWGLGNIIGPQIARPFLQPIPLDNANSSNVSKAINTSAAWKYTITNNTNAEDLTKMPIEYIFIIAFTVSSTAIITSAVLYVAELRGTGKSPSYVKLDTKMTETTQRIEQDQSWTHVFDPATCAGGQRCYGTILFILITLYYFTTIGGEGCLVNFTYSFAVKSQLNFTVDEATYLSSGFFLAFTIGRLLSAIVAKWLHPQNLINIVSAGNAMSSTIFILWGCTNHTVAWVSILSLGLFVGPLFANGFNWADRYLLMTPFAGGIPFVACSIGYIIYNYAQGYLMHHYGVIALPWMCVFFAVSLVVLGVLMQIATCGRQDRFGGKPTSTLCKMNYNPLSQDVELRNTVE